MLEFPGEGVNLRKSAVFCENLRFGRSLATWSSVPLSSPCGLNKLTMQPHELSDFAEGLRPVLGRKLS